MTDEDATGVTKDNGFWDHRVRTDSCVQGQREGRAGIGKEREGCFLGFRFHLKAGDKNTGNSALVRTIISLVGKTLFEMPFLSTKANIGLLS